MAASTSPGPGVDAAGTPVIDPTKNVETLVAASERRADDLREQQTYYQERLSHAETRYQGKLADLRDRNIENVANLREAHAERMRTAEAARIDAIRAVDTNAVAQAASVSATQATTLAGQVATSAEALRNQVEQSRIQSALTLSTALEPLQTAIAELRQVQYQQAGERVANTETKGDKQWVTMAVIAAIALVLTLGGIFMSAAIAGGLYFATH